MNSQPSPSFSSRLETAVLIHVCVLVLASSWIYGGNIWWIRPLLSAWASFGLLLTIAAFLQPGDLGRDARRKSAWLLPWLILIGLIVASSFNPSFFPIQIEGKIMFVHRGPDHPNWPSTVNPSTTLHELWFSAGTYLAAFNLMLAVDSRRVLRQLLVFCTTSAVVLAVFGTIQKLSGLGYYFGSENSPNVRFFATFIYYNHWGAFMILWLATGAGLIFYYAIRHKARDLWHSPFTVVAMGVLFMALTAPVSASRSATGMASLVVLIALAHAFSRIAAHRRAVNRPVWPPIVALLLMISVTLAATGWLAHHSISERYADTQKAMTTNKPFLSERLELYKDTWKLAMQKPVFGWGLESYGTAFMLIRPRPLAENRQYEASYMKAHSDWLQSVAETGFVGTILLMLMALIPLASVPWRALRHPLVAYPLLGCALIALYAWVEFPFANGAVLIAFWTLFFSAIRYAGLQRQSDSSGN